MGSDEPRESNHGLNNRPRDHEPDEVTQEAAFRDS